MAFGIPIQVFADGLHGLERERLIVFGLRRQVVEPFGEIVFRLFEERASPETPAEFVELLGAGFEIPHFVGAQARVESDGIGLIGLAEDVFDVLEQGERPAVFPGIEVFESLVVLLLVAAAFQEFVVLAARHGRQKH